MLFVEKQLMNQVVVDYVQYKVSLNKVLLKLYTLINFDIDKLGLGFVLLFDRISCSVGLLCFETIVNTNNDITYNERSNEFLTTRLDMSLIELK